MSSYTRKKIISLVAPVLSGLKVHKLFAPGYSGLGHILTFHRVIPLKKERRVHNHLSLEISPEQLESTILFYKKNDYKFVSLDEVYQNLISDRNSGKFVAFTFDDGYRDNYSVAYPILKKYCIPFTIYITTNFPDRKAILWWYLLEELLIRKAQITFEWEGQTYSFECGTMAAKELAFDEIKKLITCSFEKESYLKLLSVIFELEEAQLLAYSDSLVMSWEEIKTLSEDALCTIGAHTVNHLALSSLEKEDMIFEIAKSKELIEQHILQPVEHFAYPFGKVSEATFREFEAVKNMGFKTATTTRNGNIFQQHKNHLECLPRISVNRVTTEAVLNLQSNGLLPFVIQKGKKVITN